MWRFRYRFMKGETVTLPWPKMMKIVVNDTSDQWTDCGGAKKVELITDDPNYHYRPFLEQKVGKQGKDWMWRHVVGCSVFISPDFHRQVDKLEIKLSKDKAKWASVIRLKWETK